MRLPFGRKDKQVDEQEKTSKPEAQSRGFGLNSIKMKPKLIGLFLVLSLIPLAVGTIFAVVRSGDAMTGQAYNNLEAVYSTKHDQLD